MRGIQSITVENRFGKSEGAERSVAGEGNAVIAELLQKNNARIHSLVPVASVMYLQGIVLL